MNQPIEHTRKTHSFSERRAFLNFAMMTSASSHAMKWAAMPKPPVATDER